MEYTVIQADSVGEFIVLVNQMISDGWRPRGGVACFGFGIKVLYFQAMVRDAD
jgi:hypothetical protein